MDKMNKLRGEAYERFVFALLQRQVTEGRIGAPLFDVSVHHHRRYRAHSGNRIDTDVSIEVRRKGIRKRMLLILIECKAFSRFHAKTIHFNDLQAKIMHLGAHKGYLVTTSLLSKGVLQQAEHYGIGIIHLPMNGTPRWIVERRPELWGESITLHILSEEEKRIEATARKAEKEAGISRKPRNRLDDIDLLKIAQWRGFGVFHGQLPDGVRGLCNFFDCSIWLSTKMRPGSAHWRLTLAHEIGHAMLHPDLRAIVCRESSRGLDAAVRKREREAETFARALLVPAKALPRHTLNADTHRLLARHFGITSRALQSIPRRG